MAQKTVRVRLNRTMNPIDGERRQAGYETDLPFGLAEKWVKNGRITILAGKAPARAKATTPDPITAPPIGSPDGSAGALSSSHRGQALLKPDYIKGSRLRRPS